MCEYNCIYHSKKGLITVFHFCVKAACLEGLVTHLEGVSIFAKYFCTAS